MLIRQPKNVLTVTATTSIRILDKLLSSSFYSSIPWWNTPMTRTILNFELRVPFLRVVQKNSRQNTMRLWHHPGFKWVPSIKVCVLLLFISILALDYWSEKWYVNEWFFPGRGICVFDIIWIKTFIRSWPRFSTSLEKSFGSEMFGHQETNHLS